MRTPVIFHTILISALVCPPIIAEPQNTLASKSESASPACSLTARYCDEDWVGSRTTGERFQTITLHLMRANGVEHATVDLPDFGALDIPASKFSMKDDHVHFELIGDTSNAVFDGSVSGDFIQGNWQEGDQAGSFELKGAGQIHSAFRAEDVTFKSGAISLAGTLLLPRRRSRVPAIVFVQGAGQEQRFASRFLAEFFVNRGVAALIYDKRGTGESTGDWKVSSFDDLAEDVTAAVSFLESRHEVDPARIGLMGSSQGGWIAPMAALRIPDLAFLIVKSAAAVTPEQQELARVEIQMRAEGDSPADIAEALALYRHAIQFSRTGEGWTSLANEIAADSSKNWALFNRDTPKDDWFFDQIRLNFDHDPIPVLEKVKAPILVIYGGEDDDGPPLKNSIGRLLEAMRQGGKNSELEIFPSAGHDLRVVQGKDQAWDFPRFAPGYLDSLAWWVELQTKVSKDSSVPGDAVHRHRPLATVH
jgi:pimeloyl-ACP methyl ester carboxylesterase